VFVIPRGILETRKIAHAEKTRCGINGLRLERAPDGRARAVATDGKRFVLISWDDSNERGDFPEIGFKTDAKPGSVIMIPNESIDDAVKILPKKAARPICTYLAVEEEADAEGRVRIGTTKLSSKTIMETVQVEGSFPPYDEVVESSFKKPATFRVCLNADFLLELARTLHGAAGDERDDDVRLEFSGPCDPIRLSIGNPNGIEAKAILMPIAVEGGWLDEIETVQSVREKLQKKISSAVSAFERAKNDKLNAFAERDAALAKAGTTASGGPDPAVEKIRDKNVELIGTNLELLNQIEATEKKLAETEARVRAVEEIARRNNERAEKAEAGMALIESVLGGNGKKLAA
jgi:hypothetical protein